MREPLPPEVLIYVCRNCIPTGTQLARQWRQAGVYVQVKELPCSGKTDAQYLFHALEAGGRGILVVACPEGKCRLAQGNYRADIRIRMVQKLLAEIGLEPERVSLLHCGPEDDLERMVRSAVDRLCALEASSIDS